MYYRKKAMLMEQDIKRKLVPEFSLSQFHRVVSSFPQSIAPERGKELYVDLLSTVQNGLVGEGHLNAAPAELGSGAAEWEYGGVVHTRQHCTLAAVQELPCILRS